MSRPWQHAKMFTIPDSTVARQAEAYLRLTSPAHLVNHCLRSYVWAAAVAILDGVDFDREVLFVSAALHDLGLLEPFDLGNPFEVDGGQAAAEFAMRNRWAETKAAVMREAIELHVARDLVVGDGPEAYLLWHGTGVDVSGSRVDELEPAFVAEVLQEYPRLDFQTGFGGLFERQALSKPGSRASELVGDGLLQRLANCPLDRPTASQ